MPTPICTAARTLLVNSLQADDRGLAETVVSSDSAIAYATPEDDINNIRVPANSVQIGTTWHMYMRILLTSSTQGSRTFIHRVRWGGVAGTLLATLGTLTFPSSKTDINFFLEAVITIQSIGATGTAVADISGTCSDGPTANTETANNPIANSGVTAVTIDTTVANSLVLTGVSGNINHFGLVQHSFARLVKA